MRVIVNYKEYRMSEDKLWIKNKFDPYTAKVGER